MDIEKAKLIKNKLVNFLPCYKYAFLAPLEKEKLESFLKLAISLHNTPKPLKVFLTEDSKVEKILNEEFSNPEIEIYVVSKHYNADSFPQLYRDYILMEDIDFDVSRFM